MSAQQVRKEDRTLVRWTSPTEKLGLQLTAQRHMQSRNPNRSIQTKQPSKTDTHFDHDVSKEKCGVMVEYAESIRTVNEPQVSFILAIWFDQPKGLDHDGSEENENQSREEVRVNNNVRHSD